MLGSIRGCLDAGEDGWFSVHYFIFSLLHICFQSFLLFQLYWLAKRMIHYKVIPTTTYSCIFFFTFIHEKGTSSCCWPRIGSNSCCCCSKLVVAECICPLRYIPVLVIDLKLNFPLSLFSPYLLLTTIIMESTLTLYYLHFQYSAGLSTPR